MANDESSGRAAVYVRTSTDDQTVENQLADLKQWAKRLGLNVVKVYRDDGVSGSRRDRPGLTAMLEGAHRRDFDVLLIWALDRLSREGIGATLGYLKKLSTAGIVVKSHQEGWLNTADSTVAELLLSIFAWIAKQARERLSERTKAGLRRAEAQGTKLGRPPLPAATVEKIQMALKRGVKIRATARLCGVGSSSVQRISAALKLAEKKRRPKSA